MKQQSTEGKIWLDKTLPNYEAKSLRENGIDCLADSRGNQLPSYTSFNDSREVSKFMTYSPAFNPVEPQAQSSMLPYSQTSLAKTEKSVATTEAAMLAPLPQFNLATLLQYGGVTSATILSLSIFVLAMAELLKVFVPALQKQDQIPEPKTRQNKGVRTRRK
ncbi:hypothetical protein [Microcoleus sp. FACHB-672]|uniref:hypothetical protein n=1 Tax=Microcoleus sp. FACHB-672 TaxID=2692825 RepID=UPI00168552A6|nr:hypothetical protein [Microcoleus sp. FACHB-672]MBD2043161.1 hypothetical protein [Microcoleus sp. FACHB-672]